MIELVYRIEPEAGSDESLPETGEEAQRLLERGNQQFAQLLDAPMGDDGVQRTVIPVSAADLGLVGEDSQDLTQRPFALVLGCADARAPVELLFGQGANDLFVLRVAGNFLGQESLGSIDYAVHHLPSIRLLVVLGHSHCGAVTAAVKSFLDPGVYLNLATNHQLRSIVDQLHPAVNLASRSLLAVWGEQITGNTAFAEALILTATPLNAALMASMLRANLDALDREDIEAVFAVFDLASHLVGAAGLEIAGDTKSQLYLPPKDADGFARLGETVARSPEVASLIAG